MPKDKKPPSDNDWNDLIDEFDGKSIRHSHDQTVNKASSTAIPKGKPPQRYAALPGSLEMWENVKKYTSDKFEKKLNKLEAKQTQALNKLDAKSASLNGRTTHAMNKFFAVTDSLMPPSSEVEKLMKETQNKVAREIDANLKPPPIKRPSH